MAARKNDARNKRRRSGSCVTPLADIIVWQRLITHSAIAATADAARAHRSCGSSSAFSHWHSSRRNLHISNGISSLPVCFARLSENRPIWPALIVFLLAASTFLALWLRSWQIRAAWTALTLQQNTNINHEFYVAGNSGWNAWMQIFPTAMPQNNIRLK